MPSINISVFIKQQISFHILKMEMSSPLQSSQIKIEIMDDKRDTTPLILHPLMYSDTIMCQHSLIIV